MIDGLSHVQTGLSIGVFPVLLMLGSPDATFRVAVVLLCVGLFYVSKERRFFPGTLPGFPEVSAANTFA